MSIELTVLLKGRVLARSSFEIDFVRIGRSPESEVAIDNLALSRHHATLRREAGVWTLEDLRSTSGTFVNGQRVRQWHMSSGDRIGIGKFTILFEARESLAVAQRLPIQGGRTIAIGSDAAPHEREERAEPVARLVLADGTERPITRDVFSIGGAKENDLVITGWMVPPRVALITRGLAGFSVVNLVGHGWVKLGGRDVEWDSWLTSGSVLRFGRTQLKFVDEPKAASTPSKESLPCPI